MRVFLAIDLPEEVRAALGALRLPAGRQVATENLHLTLVFLGDLTQTRLQALDEALEGLDHDCFAVEFAGLGAFGAPLRNIHVAVRPNPALEALHRRLLTLLRQAGISPERRRFHPHVTLARFHRPPDPDTETRLGRFVADKSGFAAPGFIAEAVTLFRSDLRPDGPIYTPLAEYPLRGAMQGGAVWID